VTATGKQICKLTLFAKQEEQGGIIGRVGTDFVPTGRKSSRTSLRMISSGKMFRSEYGSSSSAGKLSSSPAKETKFDCNI
jgi:hypothetical protein